MYTVQIVDDEPIVRLGLKNLIPWESLGFCIIWEARTGAEALEQISSHPVDLIITDIEMPIMNGMELIRKVRKEKNQPEIVILTAFGEFEYAKGAIDYGVMDYILKPMEENDIIKTLKNVKKRIEEKVLLQEKKESIQALLGTKREFTREKDRELIRCILTADRRAEDALKDILEEERQYGEESTGVMCARFSYILEEVVSDIRKNYFYMNQVEELGGYLDYGQRDYCSKRTLEENFREKMISLLHLFEEYRIAYHDNLVRQACQYVIQHIDEKISLSLISNELCVSKNYFCSLFKQETQENFLNFVTRMKMQRAKVLLKEKNMKVYEVCDYLGYTDVTYFTRLFKKYAGMTPNEYKKGGMDQI